MNSKLKIGPFGGSFDPVHLGHLLVAQAAIEELGLNRLFFIPAAPLWQAFAFLLFRLFDIVKPMPIRHFDRTIRNGFGVMFDDLLAAFYTLLCLAGWKFLFG